MLIPWLSRLISVPLAPAAKRFTDSKSRPGPLAAFPQRQPAARPGIVAWGTLSALLSWSLAATPALAESVYQVGMGKAVITPEEPMWMSGYGSRNRPADPEKLTDLWAKALAIQADDGDPLVLVTLDLVGVDAGISKRITDQVREKYGLPRQAVAISTSHTHSGPVTGDTLRAMYFLDATAWRQVDRYTRDLEAKVVGVIGEALEQLAPAELHWTVGRAHFAVNRRNNPEPNVPELRQADRLRGPVDHDVPILVVKDPQGAIRTILCGYACHATVLSGYQWCGDWPGYAQIALEERYPDAMAMVWAGCGADQNPLPRRDLQLAKDYGAAIDQAVADALARPLIAINGPLEARYAEIPLKFAKLPSREELLETAKSENRYEASRARILLDQLDRQGELSATYPYPVQSWQLGDGPTWVFLGGEVVVDFALRLKTELSGGRTWVAGYCNDVMAYIASRRVLAEGGYEGGGAMVYYSLPSPWHPSVEDAVVGEVRRQVAQLGGPPAEAARSITPRPYTDHADLLHWLDDQGERQPVASPEDWQRRRGDILTAMQQVMGRLPQPEELPPLEVRELERETFEHYDRLLIHYRGADGIEVPAHLYLPKADGATAKGDGQRRAAVLALHPTSALGKRVVAGEGPRPNRNYAAELAERGYVVLAPDYPSFGGLTDYNFHTDRYLSGTMAAIVNHRRAVDVLAAHDQVDPQRIGVIGHSLGGHNAMFIAAFDERLQAAVSSCGWTPFHHYYGGKLAGWASDRYMPRIREVYGLDPDSMPFDFYEVAAAIAPRGFFSCSPLRDSNFDVEGVKKAEPPIRDVYRLLQAEDRFLVRYPDSEHDFPTETRMEAYAFLDQMLGHRSPAAATPPR